MWVQLWTSGDDKRGFTLKFMGTSLHLILPQRVPSALISESREDLRLLGKLEH